MKHFHFFQFCAKLSIVWLHVKAGYPLCSKMITNGNKGDKLSLIISNRTEGGKSLLEAWTGSFSLSFIDLT